MLKKQSWKWITLSSKIATGVIHPVFTTIKNVAANNLIDIYKDLNIELEIKSIVEAKYLDYYDIAFSTVNKEVTVMYYPNVTDYPFTKLEFKAFQRDVQKRVEDLLKSRNYYDYRVNVLVDWVDHNEWLKRLDEEKERQKEQEYKIFSEIESQMEQEHNIEVIAGTHPQLTFYRDGEIITNPKEVNTYHTEFIDLAIEKGTSINFKEVTTSLVNVYGEELGFKNKYSNKDWDNVVDAIDIGLKQIEELRVTSTTILTFDDPIIVNTDINSLDPNAKEVEKKIKQLINEFFQYEPISEEFSGPFDVIVQNKEVKPIENNNVIYFQQELDELQQQVDERHRSTLFTKKINRRNKKVYSTK
ncbi:hypothetical protein [Cytobacillus sp. IB215665]|uniref:hypothetical protein n=1 Tax=Cytobacillus sp. IB215665 TaxID=3097357 RepID=UPI002A0E37EE|nr:hypothetical protein [Cytobacillus sp. IB215665]MDX8367939.1 hypothetical protein [Cytobacillus sp. IB215665]